MQLLFKTSYKKMYRKLRPRIRHAADDRLRRFAHNPLDPLLDDHPLHPPYAGCRSINISGDYRAIYYRESERAVRFIAIGTHHELFGT